MNALPLTSTNGDAHYVVIGPVKYDVYRLIHLSRDMPTTRVSVAKLVEIINTEPYWEDSGGSPLFPHQVYDSFSRHGSWGMVMEKHPRWQDHVQRIRRANCRYPLLMCKGRVLDGIHRVVKAHTLEKPSLPARNFEMLPREAAFRRKVFSF